MGFKENLKEELSYQGMLVKELASRAGLNPSSISNYLRENSSVPSADVAVKIARALGVSVEYLVTGDAEVSGVSRNYPPEIIHLADSLSHMAERDRNLVAAIINHIEENPIHSMAESERTS